MDKDIINRQIGARIKAVRKEKNMTLLELANKVGLVKELSSATKQGILAMSQFLH